MDNKAPEAFRTISEVADELDVPQHVLRFWESRFHEIRPMKRGGGRRYYRPDDVDLLRGIRHLLYGEGYTIRGVQRILGEEGQKFVQSVWQSGAPQPPHRAAELEQEDVEEAGAEEVNADEAPGLRGRLSSLLGRDLNQREAELRSDPPMQAAPVPRIDPLDQPFVAQPAPAPAPVRVEPPVAIRPPMPEPNFAPLPVNAPAYAGTLPREDLRKLQAALHELGECRKILDSLSRPS